MQSPHRGPGQRAGLTHGLVLTAAHELLSEHGLDGLSMRALAHHLGVSPNALYSHVPSKTALIDDLLDDALAVIRAPAPDPGVDPIVATHTLMASTYQMLLARSDLIALYLARQGARGPNAQHLGEITLALLARAGITGPRAREALHVLIVLIVYTIGSAAFAARSPLSGADTPPGAAEDHEARFDRGLRWILAGLAPSH